MDEALLKRWRAIRPRGALPIPVQISPCPIYAGKDHLEQLMYQERGNLWARPPQKESIDNEYLCRVSSSAVV